MNNKGSVEVLGPTLKANHYVFDNAVFDIVKWCIETTTSWVVDSTWSYRCKHSK